jgi:hypothetical protein
MHAALVLHPDLFRIERDSFLLLNLSKSCVHQSLWLLTPYSVLGSSGIDSCNLGMQHANILYLEHIN